VRLKEIRIRTLSSHRKKKSWTDVFRSATRQR
jgi:hypothetical protein